MRTKREYAVAEEVVVEQDYDGMRRKRLEVRVVNHGLIDGEEETCMVEC
ncbi:hypothetical protein L195_g018326 [Trifolium pratense]|uniref:Uncharacterized protein n=1 Tax=Trifolium pratense TaxID=57577 RepID=A0A2K3MWF8_TRIPR|nr:hypothetical protein L195_g018326 [Trifolium pratense]